MPSPATLPTPPANANLFELLAATIEAMPASPAVRCGSTLLTYADLDLLTAKVSALLQERGVRPGDRVALMMPNVPEFAVTYFGALRAGAAVVPMNPLLKSREIDFYLGDPDVSVLFAWHGFRAEVESDQRTHTATQVVMVDESWLTDGLAEQPADTEVAGRQAGDTAVILYTSGTTGRPKGAELTHANLSSNAEVGVDVLELGAGDVVIGSLPLFHCFGQTCGLNAVVTAGATVALVPRFSAEGVLATIQEYGASTFLGVPTMYNAMLHFPQRDEYDVSSLSMCASGGAALPAEVLYGFEEAFGCALLEGYGLSETSPIASFNKRAGRKPGTIGTPVDGVEIKVVGDDGSDLAPGEIGEIAIRGHNVMKGYWGRPEATAEAIDAEGWFRTGDMGRMDEDGFFTIVDRKKEMIIRGGFNVYPREIEEVLYEHPAVRECAVLGIPDDHLGEEVGAAVVLEDSAAASPEELREFVRTRVAAYKYPRKVWLSDELPKGPTNKILKREIQIPSEVTA